MNTLTPYHYALNDVDAAVAALIERLGDDAEARLDRMVGDGNRRQRVRHLRWLLGVDAFRVGTGLRDYNEQAQLWRQWKLRGGAAVPVGQSQHQEAPAFDTEREWVL